MVSGNSYITAAKVLTSGDAMISQRVSGLTDFIGLRAARTEVRALTNNVYQEVTDYVEAIMSVNYPSSRSGAQDRMRTMVNDFKITVASGSWLSGGGASGVSFPVFVSESWPIPLENKAQATLLYRVKYLL